eukprot:TRINITY_DN27305_c0_g1_i1.p1 TRINITY_DN27305_c0_g1~~TRINITY_DN27305_c0_g1_i1.p1  ORF type:complete len:877 (+),score=317.45 TRINITY_DN27305_c0_g1_i1:34-2631(+)
MSSFGSSPVDAALSGGQPTPILSALAAPVRRSPLDEFFDVAMSPAAPASLSNSYSDNGSNRQSEPPADKTIPDEGQFVIKVTALLMGIKTLSLSVRPSTTVHELKEMIQASDESCPPPDRQRVTYSNQELSQGDVTLSSLEPPACEGSNFSMAVELKMEPFFEEVHVSVVHYHGYTDTIDVPKETTVGGLMEILTEKDADKWTNGKLMLGDDDLTDEESLLKLSSETTGAVTLQFFPLPNYNGTVQQAQDLDVQYNGVRMTGDAAPASPSSGMWFEVRLYEGGSHQSVTIKIHQEKTVQDLKEAIHEAYQADHFRLIPVDKMKLLCNAQMRGDTELVAGFSVGDRGTREQPAIMQLYIRTESDVYDMEVDEEEAVDAFPVLREERQAPCGCTGRSARAHQLLFFAVGLSFLIMIGYGVSAVMSAKHDTGFCHPTMDSRKYSSCEPRADGVWRPTSRKLSFTSSEVPLQLPCFDCTFSRPHGQAFSGFSQAHEECFMGMQATLPVVSGFIPTGLCIALETSDSSQQYDWVDMELVGGVWVTSAGRALKIDRGMWEGGEPVAGNSRAVIRRGSCKLVSVSEETVRQGSKEIGTLCMRQSHTDDLLDSRQCRGDMLVTSAAAMASTGPDANKGCSTFCRDWCFANSQHTESCCEAHVPQTFPQVCNCSLKTGPTYTVTDGHSVFSNSAKKVESSVDAKVIVAGHALFVRHERTKMAGMPDLDVQYSANQDEQDCALQCAARDGCAIAALEHGKCALYSGSATTDYTNDTCCSTLSRYSDSTQTCDVEGHQTFDTKLQCLQYVWDGLYASFSCTDLSDGTCSTGHESGWPATSLAVIVAAGIIFFCSFAGLACRYSHRQMSDGSHQVGR